MPPAVPGVFTLSSIPIVFRPLWEKGWSRLRRPNAGHKKEKKCPKISIKQKSCLWLVPCGQNPDYRLQRCLKTRKHRMKTQNTG